MSSDGDGRGGGVGRERDTMAHSFLLCIDDPIGESATKTIAPEGSQDKSNPRERWYTVASQVFLPFMIAGFGMVAAGLVLERVKVFTYVLAATELR